ncbi:hypothetical protein [Nocardioides sp. zg-1228]|uniref:hypothetical protein n=1 Tax=Nocardioides sp. zg-1228 TaxID=2763008 RepID=UPI001642A8E2|nr:hypothetical protein [Nocardioides sp. zg-1228]MBC2932938.1 hypothetical protein [Nocardioides sp. zg-1228]QSF56861.1 hypothetical protein JX575_14845 [Nocardioides sp. zg-1228]
MASGTRFINLDVELVEPIELQRLESLSIRIRDDRPGRADEIDYESPRHQAQMLDTVRSQVWGPFRFTPGVGPKVGSVWNPADQAGRQCDVSTPLEVGEALRFQLEPTRSPWLVDTLGGVASDARDAEWRHLVGDNIRLTITARAAGSEPWVIPLELSAGTPTVAFR